MDDPIAHQSSAQPTSNNNCLIITAIVVGLAFGACILAALLMVIVARSYPGLPPGALEGPSAPGTPREATAPDAAVSLVVLSDGCAVERGEVQGTDDVRMLTWVIAGQDGIPVLERNAENETRYRYFGAGDYTVTVKAWYEGVYYPISAEVRIRCP